MVFSLTTIIPLDHAIQQVMKLGYTHHINRLMVIGNMMLMCKIHLKESYRWFGMFIDSSDWVMGAQCVWDESIQ